MSYHRLDLVSQKIDSLEGLDTISGLNFVVIDLKDNYIHDFQSFGTHASLVELDVRRNRIESFFGLTRQQSLEIIRIDGNPITDHPLYRIMILQTVGYTLRMIDSKAVTSTEVSLAKRLGGQAALAVSCGWILDVIPRTQREYMRIIEQRRTDYHTKVNGSSSTPLIGALHKLTTVGASGGTVMLHDSFKQNFSNSLQEAGNKNLNPEVIYASQIEFDDGISIWTNLHQEQKVLGVIRFSGPLLCFQDFLRKRTIIKLDVRRTTIISASRDMLTFLSSFGVEVKASFTSLEVLEAVRRTFMSRQEANPDRVWGSPRELESRAGNKDSLELVKSCENDGNIQASVARKISQTSSPISSKNKGENQGHATKLSPQNSMRNSISMRSDADVKPGGGESPLKAVLSSSTLEAGSRKPSSLSREVSGTPLNGSPTVNQGEKSVNALLMDTSLSRIKKEANTQNVNANSNKSKIPPSVLSGVDPQAENYPESLQKSLINVNPDSVAEICPPREEIELEVNKRVDSSLVEEALGDDGGVKTPLPQEMSSRPAATSKFQDFIIDSDSDSD